MVFLISCVNEKLIDNADLIYIEKLTAVGYSYSVIITVQCCVSSFSRRSSGSCSGFQRVRARCVLCKVTVAPPEGCGLLGGSGW